MSGILGIAILVLDILAIIDIFKGGKTSGQKVIWLLIVLLLPLIGMVLYFLLGKKK